MLLHHFSDSISLDSHQYTCYKVCIILMIVNNKTQESCRICASSGPHNKFVVKEMMLGTRDQFDYFQCSQCECIQILSVPKNLHEYYSADKYYSFRSKSSFITRYISKLSYKQTGVLYRIMKRYLIIDPNLLSIGRLGIPTTSRILDVGSGSGSMLRDLQTLGYVNAIGIDPYIETDIEIPVKVIRKKVQDLDQNTKFDLILFMHSIEHVPDPLSTLSASVKLLNKNGVLLIRTPIVSAAFEAYGRFWYQLDAPRHLFVYSTKALSILFSKLDFKLVDHYYDSNEAQFIWSERYKDNIAMSEDQRGFFYTILRKLFSEKVNMAKKMNSENRGDQAVFYLKSNK